MGGVPTLTARLGSPGPAGRRRSQSQHSISVAIGNLGEQRSSSP